MKRLALANSDEANELLSNSAFALVFGMILDQQFPLERAFAAPYELHKRLGQPVTADRIVGIDIDDLKTLFATPPALHRFPAANAERVQAMAQIVLDQYEGRTESIWETADTGTELLKRINALPGFGKRKAQIFVALLGKQLGVQPEGWKQACSPFGDEGTTMSIADITDRESLLVVREWKKSQKARAKAAE